MQLNLLTVDGSGETRIELAGMLKDYTVQIHHASDWMEAEYLLARRERVIHAVLFTMDAMDDGEFDAIRQFKLRQGYGSIPVIVISRLTDKKYIVKAISAGAVEYIAKPFSEDTLVGKLGRVLETPLEKKPEFALEEEIITYTFKEIYSKEIKAASRGGYPLSILMVSVRPDKPREASAETANQLLLLINRVIKGNLRETDICFPYREDILIILLPFTDKVGMASIERKMAAVFQSHSVIQQKNPGYSFVTASVSYPEDGKIKGKLIELLEEKFWEKLGVQQ